MTLIAMRTLTLVLIAAALAACTAGQSRTDIQTPSPWELVRSGRETLDKGEFIRAEYEFDRALAANPDFAPALAGKALVAGARKLFRRAATLLSQASGRARTPEERMFLHLARLHYHELLLRRPGLRTPERQQIIAEALISFHAAQRIQPVSSEAHYRMGQVYKAGLEFELASEMFYRVLGDRGRIGDNARKEWAPLQRIRQLNPRTTTARRIALTEGLSWGEAAALLTEEFELRGHLARLRRGSQPGFKTPREYAVVSSSRMPTNPDDLLNPLATMARMGVRGLEPQGALDPGRPLTRGVFALILEDVLIKLAGDKRLPVRFIGRPSRFADVRPDHYAYNAIVVTTTLKFLSPVKPNVFGLLEPVSGIEALAALQRLRGMLRLS